MGLNKGMFCGPLGPLSWTFPTVHLLIYKLGCSKDLWSLPLWILNKRRHGGDSGALELALNSLVDLPVQGFHGRGAMYGDSASGWFSGGFFHAQASL